MKPQIAILHYTAPPIIGGVENIIAQHTRLFIEAGYPVTVLVGRGGMDDSLTGAKVLVIPEIDSEHSTNQEVLHALLQNTMISNFYELQMHIEKLLQPILTQVDVLFVHNAFNFHFNLPLTVALHHLIDQGTIHCLIAWCHDISRFVNPASGEEMRTGFPWDMLREFRMEVTYVAVSQHRQHALAKIFGRAADDIQVIPNGVNLFNLLGLGETSRHLIEEFALLEGSPVMLMPVRITRAKNIEFALRVTAALKSFGFTPRLVVTGPPDPHSLEVKHYLDELLTLRQELALNEEVNFVYEGTSRLPGPLTIGPDIVAELYRVVDLVLLPSHREGFGLGVLEAGLVGKPIFCTHIPVLEEIGENLVHCIEPGESPYQVAERFQAWMQHDRTFLLTQRVRQKFTWSSLFVHAIEPLVQRVVDAQEIAK